MNEMAARAALQTIALGLLRLAPPGSAGVHLRVSAVGDFTRYQKWTIRPGGTETVLNATTPASLDRHVDALRRAAARPRAGTWFTADITALANGGVGVHYGYDNEPDFGSVFPTEQDFAADLAEFPRDPDLVPDWFRRRLG